MEKAKRKFTAAKGWLTQNDNNCADLLKRINNGDFVTKSELEHIISQFETKLQVFDDREENLEEQIEDESELEEQITHCGEFRASKSGNYLKLKEVMRVKDDNESATMSTGIHASGHGDKIGARLPKLELPKFDGDVTSWQSFTDKFSAIIDDRHDISDINKFTYLQSLLVGEAKACIQGLSLTGDNYRTAKELLQKRFGRREKVIFGHIQKLLSISSSRKQDLWQLYDELTAHVRSLSNLGVNGAEYGIILTPLLLHQLPPNYRLEWSRDAEGKEGDLEYLMTFMYDEIRRRERSQAFNDTLPTTVPERKRKTTPSTAAALFNQRSGANRASMGRLCSFCPNKHYPDQCPAISSLTFDQRKEKIKDSGLCYVCLSPSHRARNCVKVCFYCKGKHHSILCSKHRYQSKGGSGGISGSNTTRAHQAPTNSGFQEVPPDFVQTSSTAPQFGPSGISWSNPTIAQGAGNNSGVFYSSSKSVSTIMQVVKCEINGKELTVLFDSGSDRSFIKTESAKRLGLRPIGSENLSLSGFGDMDRNDQNCDLFELSMHDNFSIVLLGIKNISAPMYRAAIPSDILRKIENVPIRENLAFGNQIHVDVLIGLDYYWKVVEPGFVVPGTGLVTQKSQLGWFVSGSFVSGNSSNNSSNTSLFCQSQEPTEATIRRCWELDSIGIGTNCPNDEDKTRVEFNEGIEFHNGRYQVGLTWKSEDHKGTLINNLGHAERRLKSLMRKLDSNPSLKGNYNEVLSDLEGQGIIEEVNQNAPPPQTVYYLPHRPVVREDSQTTKVRPVFDASARGENGVSLNDCMQVGPNLTPNLVKVLLRFRRWRYGLTGDIQKAFLQIELRESDKDVHRFLWDVNGQVRQMRFNRVTFGNSSSPFLLNATITHHLSKFESTRTVDELRSNLYVDDWLTGADKEEDIKEMMSEATDVMMQGGFPLTKWATNSCCVSKGLNKPLTDSPTEELGPHKVLGIEWNTDEDCFQFSSLHEHVVNKLLFTKRRLLGMIAQQFDPLGFLTPFTISLKILFQETWRVGHEWDTTLPDETQRQIEHWIEGLKIIKQWKIPRRLTSQAWTKSQPPELIVFSDASQKAYGCCIYLKTCTEHYPEINLIISKVKVAPLKQVTLPRLELLAALLASRLVDFVRKALELPENTIYTCYTDSKIAQAWIQGEPNRWKQFVRNRVVEIQDLTDPARWKYCSSKDNPADMVTRGISANALITSSVWLKGPEWLKTSVHDEDIRETKVEPETENLINEEELQTRPTCTFVQESDPLLQYDRFSSFGKLLRVLALVLKFVKNLKRKNTDKANDETENELDIARSVLLKQVQREYYSKEIVELLSNNIVGKKSPIAPLSPFWGKDGLIRVHGRLDQAACLLYDERHPILLPKCRLSYLLVRAQHESMKHAGVDTMITALRNKFWILSVRSLAKRVVRSCVNCQRVDKRPMNQTPAPLPKDRLSQTPPFSVIGIDYAGPLFCTDSENKLYILLFTCAVTRAVHIELVDSLSMIDFVMAFRRFVARRAMPSIIYSDNAKTFKAASLLLQKQFDNVSFTWKFSVPLAPWYGGFWERMIRSTKSCLKKSLGRSKLARTELETVIPEVEACINSRPLTSVANQGPPLTPSHFLIGRGTPLVSCELENYERVTSLSARIDRQRQTVNAFWEIWKQDYLRNLPPLTKVKENKSLFLGATVLIKDEGKSRLEWPLGIVVKLFKGRDGLVRAVQLKTEKGIIVRAIKKLVHLELEEAVPPVPDPVTVTETLDPPNSQTFAPLNAPNAGHGKGQFVTRRGRKVKERNILDL